ATALFLKEGFGATSIEAVARRAGISKRTFYRRFRGKEELFEAVIRRLIERWTPSFDATLFDGATLGTTLRQAGSYMLDAALSPEAIALHRVVVAEAAHFPGLARISYEVGAGADLIRIARLLEQR